MKKLEEQKLHRLYLLYSQKGFDFTVEQVAEMLGVTPKTIYNRYQTKEKMVQSVVDYWEVLVCRSVENRIKDARHAVEALLVFIYEVYITRRNSSPIFRLKSQQIARHDMAGFRKLTAVLRTILKQGIADGDFKDDMVSSSYLDFLMVTVFYFITYNQLDSDMVRYTLMPLLTSAGLEKLNKTDLNFFFSAAPSLPFVPRQI